MKTIINLTGHDLDIYDGEVKIKNIKSKGKARVLTKVAKFDDLNVGNEYDELLVPVFKSIVDKVEGLPPYSQGTVFIVSRITAEGAREIGRQVDDLLIPTSFVRIKGKVVGCQSFERI